MLVLLIEDHKEMCELVGRALEKDGHRVVSARSVSEADAHMLEHDFDAYVLDLGLPDGDGLTWCRRLRANGVRSPLLVLTAQSAIATRVAGLDAGADDFLPKPFAVAELRARMRALGRRGARPRRTELLQGPVRLDFAGRVAMVHEVEVPLTSREWAIVELLTSRAGHVVLRSEIIDSLWTLPTPAAEASLEVLVGRIRKKLGADFIRTVRGEGYAAR
ncbi:MAG: response regulator transcription factor [Polyangiaceae bacterium]